MTGYTSYKLSACAHQIDFASTVNELLVAGSDGVNVGGGYHVKPGGDLALQFSNHLHSSGASFSPNGNHVRVHGYAKEVRIWTRDAGGAWPDRYRVVKLGGGNPNTAFSQDSRMLVVFARPFATNGLTSQLSVWSLDKPGIDGHLSPIRTNYPLEKYKVFSLAFSPDNQHFAAGRLDAVKLWSVDHNKPVVEFEDSARPACLEFSPDGKYLAAGLSKGSAIVWDVTTGKRHGSVLNHNGDVRCIQFSSDGRFLLTGSDEGTAQVWQVSDCSPAGPSVEHIGKILDVAFSPTGDRFATASDDGTARVWDLETRQPLSAPLVHGSAVNHLDFNHDGELLATSSENGDIRLWKMAGPNPETPAEELIKLAKSIGRYELKDGRLVRIPW